MTATWSTFSSVNQRSPFGSAVMSQGCAFGGVGIGYSVMSPCVVISPDLVSDALRVNQRLPSAPTVIPYGRLSCHSSGNSVIVPLGVIRPIVPRSDSVNQRFPSGPGTIVYGRLSACGSGNSRDIRQGARRKEQREAGDDERRSNPRLEHGSPFPGCVMNLPLGDPNP